LIDKLVISAREERREHSVIRTVLIRSDADVRSVSYEISGEILPPPMQVYDFAVVAAIFIALREGRPIHVEGPVTESLLRNLEEFQEAWAMWRRSYKCVGITADQILPPPPPQPRKGVFAASGGVDATFALLRHHSGHAGLRTARPVCAMMVHGFDIPLTKRDAFDRAHRGVAAMTSALGIPLATVRTNWREVACKNWLMEYYSALSSCLHLFHGLANVGVAGAGEDYAHLVFPWASNPVTNHLLSGGGFEVHTEGGGFDRTARVRLICDYPEIASKLRVCWEGPITGENCGRCEKCVRTMLNFMAIKQEPLCFSGKPTHAQILGLTARNPIQLAFLREILANARKNGVRERWPSTLAIAIAKNRAMLPIWRFEDRLPREFARTFGLYGTQPRRRVQSVV
jgi:hypothetical protein